MNDPIVAQDSLSLPVIESQIDTNLRLAQEVEEMLIKCEVQLLGGHPDPLDGKDPEGRASGILLRLMNKEHDLFDSLVRINGIAERISKVVE